jgi:hypothetical protein
MIAGMGHDIAGGIWPILVDRVAALVSGAGYTLDRHAVATLA